MTQTLSEHASDEQKLRSLVDSLKKKYGEAVEKNYSLETKARELLFENSSLKQTQSALSQKFNEMLVELQQLREKEAKLFKEHSDYQSKASDAESEVKALREQHAELLKRVLSYEEESKKTGDELAAVKLKEVQLERVIQFLRKRSEEAHLETNAIAQELATAQEQLTHLAETKQLLNKKEEALEQAQEELEALTEQLKSLGEQFSLENQKGLRLEEEVKQLREELHDQNTRYDTLQKEHTFLKTSMMRSVDEVKEEFDRSAKLHQEKEKELLDEVELLKSSIAHFEAREVEIEQANLLRASLEKEKMAYFSEIDQLKSQNIQLVADKEEIEQRFKTAQQHLAKKVREAALATEKIDAEKLKAIELQNQLNQANLKISELKNSLEMEAEHQKRVLARESELLKNQESQNARLEEKYFQMHERWKEAEANLRELKKIEEKWREAEKLFSKLTHFAVKPKPELIAKVEEPPKVDPIHEQISLFEEPKSTPRFKETLL